MNDENVKERLMKATSVEEIQAIANECGKELTANEAAEVLSAIQGAQAGEGEIADDALEAVTGGKDGPYYGWDLFKHLLGLDDLIK